MRLSKVQSVMLCLGILIHFFSVNLFAQTEGYIYKPASTSEGRSVLDPNGTGNVFNNGVTYFGIPELQQEPLGDPRTGASGGHTELIRGNDDSPASFMFYDSNKEAILFRVRLAGQSTASKGYSFLFNSDFDVFGPKTGNFSQTNPGFQFEVVLETGTGVTIYELNQNGIVSSNTLIGGTGPYFQKAFSDLTSEDETGFFYDFYVPLSELNGLLSSTDPFKVVATTVTRAQSGITGTISDIAGVDDNLYRDQNNAFINFIESTTPTTLNDISGTGSGFENLKSAIPASNVPLEGETSLSGTSTEADGTIITLRIYDANENEIASETTSVSSNTWNISGLNPFEFGQFITAEADATGKDPSGESDPIFVRSSTDIAVCTSPLSSALRGGNKFNGFVPNIPSGALASDLIIRLYEIDGGGGVGPLYISTDSNETAIVSEGIASYTTFNSVDGGIEFELASTGGNPYNTELFVTAQYRDECESQAVESGTSGTFISGTPVITPGEIDQGDTSVSGTSNPDAVITVFVNGVDIESTTTADTNGNWTLSDLDLSTFSDGDEVVAQSLDPGTGALPSANSNLVVVGTQQSLPPVVLGSYLNGDTDISGSSIEGGSVVIQLYINNSFTGNTTTDAFGNWDFTLESGNTLETGDIISAIAIAPGKSASVFSNEVVTQASQSAPPTVLGPIRTGDNALTVTSGGDMITLYIDGESIATKSGPGEVTFEAGTEYELGDLYKGAEVTASNQDVNSTQSELSSPVEVESVESFRIEYSDFEGNVLNAGNITNQTPNEPFFVNITALDESGDVFENFNGNATLDVDFPITSESEVTSNFMGGILEAHQIIALDGANNVDITAISQDDPLVTGASNEFDILGEGLVEVELSLGSCWRVLSSPLQSATYADLLGPVWTQGADGSDYPPGDPNIFIWPTTAPDESDDWEGVDGMWQSVTDLDTEIPAGTGFMVSIFSDNNFDGTDDTEPITLSFTGFERLANVTPLMNENETGWTLAGNPYTSTVDFNDTERINLTNVAYVYDRSAGGTNGDSGAWLSYSTETGSGDFTDGLIAPFQGFFIQNDGEDASLTFNENSRSETESDFYGKDFESYSLRFKLEGENLVNSAWISFSEKGDTRRLNGDAYQLTPFSENFALLSTGKADELFDIAQYPMWTESYSIPVHVETTKPGTYTISITDFNLPLDAGLIFEDRLTNETLRIDESFAYMFEVKQAAKMNSNPLGCSANTEELAKRFMPQQAKMINSERFVIRMDNAEESNLPESFTLMQNYPNPFNPATTIRYELPVSSDIQLEIFDLTGRSVAILIDENIPAGRHSVNFDASQLASGIYLYRLRTNQKILTRKLTLIK